MQVWVGPVAGCQPGVERLAGAFHFRPIQLPADMHDLHLCQQLRQDGQQSAVDGARPFTAAKNQQHRGRARETQGLAGFLRIPTAQLEARWDSR